jgi:hypothetical protein
VRELDIRSQQITNFGAPEAASVAHQQERGIPKAYEGLRQGADDATDVISE